MDSTSCGGLGALKSGSSLERTCGAPATADGSAQPPRASAEQPTTCSLRHIGAEPGRCTRMIGLKHPKRARLQHVLGAAIGTSAVNAFKTPATRLRQFKYVWDGPASSACVALDYASPRRLSSRRLPVKAFDLFLRLKTRTSKNCPRTAGRGWRGGGTATMPLVSVTPKREAKKPTPSSFAPLRAIAPVRCATLQ